MCRTYTRVSYTYDYKLQVINFLRESGSISATMARFFRAVTDLPRSSYRKLINKWSVARDHIEARAAHHRTASQRRAHPAGLDRVLPSTVEAALVKWINDLRRGGVPVSASMLRLQACDLAAEEGIDSSMFSASWQWRRSFMKLYRFSFRTKTHQGQEPLADALERAAEFVLKVGRTIAVEGINTIYNADQTAVNFEFLPRTTLNATGRSTVWVRCGKKEKQRMTAMLMGDSNGNKYPLFLIMKTTPSKVLSVQAENNRNRHGFGRRVWVEVKRLQSEYGIQIFGNKTAWWTGALAVEFPRHHFSDRTPFSDPIMILLDDFSGHWVEEAAAYAKTLRIVLEKVPPGLTWLWQPADCVWIKPVKDRLRSYWVAFLRQQLSLHRAKTAPAVFDMQPPQSRDGDGMDQQRLE